MKIIEQELLNLTNISIKEALKIITQYKTQGYNIEYRIDECKTTGRKRLSVISYSDYNKPL